MHRQDGGGSYKRKERRREEREERRREEREEREKRRREGRRREGKIEGQRRIVPAGGARQDR